jgi:hypothetical protein
MDFSGSVVSHIQSTFKKGFPFWGLTLPLGAIWLHGTLFCFMTGNFYINLKFSDAVALENKILKSFSNANTGK